MVLFGAKYLLHVARVVFYASLMDVRTSVLYLVKIKLEYFTALEINTYVMFVGQRFALLELKVAICGILRNFELEPVDTPENIPLVVDLVLRTKNDTIRVKFIPREK